jgi:hypothetical protein
VISCRGTIDTGPQRANAQSNQQEGKIHGRRVKPPNHA